jgi:hypothetical protein
MDKIRRDVQFVIKGKIPQEALSKIDERLDKFLIDYKKRLKTRTCKEFKTEFKTMHEEGNRAEYEVKIKLVTDFGVFHSEQVGWDAFNTFSDAIGAIKEQTKDLFKK